MIFELHRFILIFIRITAFIVATPGYSYRGVPNITKITVSAGIALFVYLTIPDVVEFQGLLPYGLLVVRETILGLALGFISQMVFSAIEMAGKLIDFQVGFSIGAVYDPTMGASASNYGRTYYWIGIAVFFPAGSAPDFNGGHSSFLYLCSHRDRGDRKHGHRSHPGGVCPGL